MILWPLYIILCIAFNYIKIDKKKIRPRYLVSNVWRSLFGLICLIIMTIDKGFDPANDFFWQIWNVRAEIVYIVSSFYLFFDPGLNGLRGKRWNYRGQNSGYLDRTKIVVYYGIKVACLGGLIWSLTELL